jgi:hypothetical protein
VEGTYAQIAMIQSMGYASCAGGKKYPILSRIMEDK